MLSIHQRMCCTDMPPETSLLFIVWLIENIRFLLVWATFVEYRDYGLMCIRPMEIRGYFLLPSVSIVNNISKEQSCFPVEYYDP